MIRLQIYTCLSLHHYYDIICDVCLLQKVHTFQASLEAVLAQLGEAEQGQKCLTNTDNSLQASDDPNYLRNQLKVREGVINFPLVS